MKWSTEAKVGAFALAGIALFSGMMVELGNVVLFGNKGFDVTGYFEDAEGIEPGSSIQYAGVEVGRVNSIAVKDGQAVLSLRLYEGTQIPERCGIFHSGQQYYGWKNCQSYRRYIE